MTTVNDAAQLQASSVLLRDFYAHIETYRVAIRGLGDWVALSKDMDQLGGIVNLSQVLNTLCRSYEILLACVRGLPPSDDISALKAYGILNATVSSSTWRSNQKLVLALERCFSDLEVTLAQVVQTFGTQVVQNHVLNPSYLRVIKVVLGEAPHPLSVSDGERHRNARKLVQAQDLLRKANSVAVVTDSISSSTLADRFGPLKKTLNLDRKTQPNEAQAVVLMKHLLFSILVNL